MVRKVSRHGTFVSNIAQKATLMMVLITASGKSVMFEARSGTQNEKAYQD